MRAIFDSLSRWRRPLLAFLTISTFASVAMIPRLRAVFAPEELVPPSEEDRARFEALLGPFGDDDAPLLVVIRADDVLSLDALRFTHALARHFTSAPWVERVNSLTTTAFPHLVQLEPDHAVTLDVLESEDDEPDALDPALGRAIATAPARFPSGLLSLAERLDGKTLQVAPLVSGKRVEKEDRDTIEAWARNSPLVRGRLLSADRQLAVIVIEPRLRGDALEAEVRKSREWLMAQRAPEGVQAELAGMPEVRASMVDALRGDQIRLVVFAILGSLIVLAIGTRSASGTILPLAAAGITSAHVIGAMAILDEPLNLLNNTVAPLLITIGIGDAVHLFARYREELAHTPDRFEAARRTMRAMSRACFLTATTTAVGFGSLIVSETEVVQRYALTAALGVMFGYLVTITFLPAALPSFAVRPETAHGSTWLDRAVRTLADVSARRAVPMLALAFAILGASLWLGRSVRVDSTLSAQLGADSSVRRTLTELEAKLSGVRTFSIGLHAPTGIFDGDRLAHIAELQAWLRSQPEVLRVDGPPELLDAVWAELTGVEEPVVDPVRAAALAELMDREAPELTRRHLRDGTRARIEVRLADAGEARTARLLGSIEERLALWEGVDSVVGGEAARSARGLERLMGDLGGSVGLAMLIIFTTIGGTLRSVRLGLISILPNVMPLAITLAYMALRDIPLHAATMIVFSISVGLAVDDTIHLLARYREEISSGRERLDAVRESLRSSGRAALLSVSTLWVGFATLAFASFVPIRLFGELSLVALGSALVCELLVLPATLATFGPKRISQTRETEGQVTSSCP